MRVFKVGGGSILLYLTTVFNFIDYITPSATMMLNFDFGKMWKDYVAAYFKALSKHLPGRTEKFHDRSQSFNQP